MFGNRSRYRGRGGKSSTYPARSKNDSSKSTSRGLFANGVWHCDCSPRLPAEHFKVKKEGKNRGRWFYTCQQAQDKRCGFFLWDEDAKLREEGAVLNNSRTETVNPDRAGQGISRGMAIGSRIEDGGQDEETETEDEKESPPKPNGSTSIKDNRKRTADEAMFAQDDLDDEFGWSLNGQEAEELIASAESVAPETPRKTLKTGIYATPATTTDRKRKLPWLEELAATPVTPAASINRRIDELFTPSKAQQSEPVPVVVADVPQTPQHPPLVEAKSPQAPNRFYDAFANPADSTSVLTNEVMAELSTVLIPPEVLGSLRSVLSKHDLKAQGVIKGRDLSRLAIKAKDAKIAELQARIASLEADKEVERAIRRAERAMAGTEDGVILP